MNDSALHQAWKHMQVHDSGIITARCEKYTEEDHAKRNLSLIAKLRHLGYFTLKVNGSYIECHGSDHARELDAVLLLVVDIADSGCLEQKLCELGAEFEQDSILFVHAGGLDGKLIDTSPRSIGEVKKLSNPLFDENGEVVNHDGHPFSLSGDSRIIQPPGTRNGKWGCAVAAKTKWEELDVPQ
ncbi:hypothetical protein [Marinobacter maritimus]|uniref:hypothetical protein n=1 Tax=Marinobacter maritimus TaxID=277961 RepID=UPI0011AAABAB|nr:hypothetical protein [Marinobacter maritimus]